MLFSDSLSDSLHLPQDDANGGRQSQRRNALLAFKKRVSDIKHEVESDMQDSADYICTLFVSIAGVFSGAG